MEERPYKVQERIRKRFVKTPEPGAPNTGDSWLKVAAEQGQKISGPELNAGNILIKGTGYVASVKRAGGGLVFKDVLVARATFQEDQCKCQLAVYLRVLGKGV